MCRIVVDLNEDRKWNFAIRKKSNHAIAFSSDFDNKEDCKAAIKLFIKMCMFGDMWSTEIDGNGFKYAKWATKNFKFTVHTRSYRSTSNMKATINHITENIHSKTSIVYSTIVK